MIPHVSAAQSCEATLSYSGKSAKIENMKISSTKTRTGYIYFAKLKGNGKSVFAFCLDFGKHSGTRYSKTSSGNITTIMKKAYAYIQNANINTPGGEIRYIVAQTAIWLEQENGSYNQADHRRLIRHVANAYFDSNNLTLQIRQIESHINNFANTSPYSGNLYIFASTASASGYQRFLAGLDMPTCPQEPLKKYCPSPNENIDITSCVDEGNTYAFCVARDCPSDTPACEGYKTKIEGTPAVCNNKGTENMGNFEEVVDTNECGDADEEGFSPSGTRIGQYCELYCKESVQQQYPGSIVESIPIGTHIVWPTSSTTQNTFWKNSYSLKYTGLKTCKVVVTTKKTKDEEGKTIEDKLKEYAQKVNRYIGKYNLSCDSNYTEADFSSAKMALAEAEKNLASKKKAYEEEKDKVDACKKKPPYLDTNGYNRCMNGKNEAINKGYISQEQAESDCKAENTHQENCGDYDSEERAYYDAKNTYNLAKADYDNLERKRECSHFKNATYGANAILEELKSCVEYQFSATGLYNFESSTSISYGDPEYGKNNQIQLNGSTSYSCEGCNSDLKYQDILAISNGDIGKIYENLYATMNDKIITIQADATYYLPAGYQYIDKGTGKPLKNPVNGQSIPVGYTFLPISFNAKATNYDLKIYVNSLGEDGKFTDSANSQSYVCNYEVTKAPSSECVCPVESQLAGSDLSVLVSASNGAMTCADAQAKYCGGIEKYYCPSDQSIEITSCIREGKWLNTCIEENCPGANSNTYCPNDSSIKLNACVNSGHSYQYCVDNLCNINNQPDYHCPKGTYNDGMDIKPCVFANIDMGLEAALQYCKDTVCPYKGGINIIYRTISLRNPFPGKTAGVNKSNTTMNFSLDNLNGRYPGSNWNSQTLVKNQILFNRNVEGNKVYEKEPLYTFILDTNTIKEIRKYNNQQEKSGGYADWTLECNSKGVACISNNFVRNAQYGIVSGVCSTTSHGNFYGCAES